MAEHLKAPHPLQAALSNKNFRRLWTGGSISVLGSQFTLIALPWLVLQLTNDASALGLVLALAGLPRAVFMLFGGAITDRLSPRRILLACDWLNFVLAAVVSVLVFTHSIQIWMVYIYSLATGLLAGFVIPAANSIAPLVLPEQDLQAGNSLSMGTSQLMGFLGPALAGVIIGSYAKSTGGIGLAFAVDSISFAFSAVMLGLMHGVDREMPAGLAQGVVRGILASIGTAARYLFGQRTLRLIFITMNLTNFLFTGPLLVGIPLLAKGRLAEGAAAFGLLMSGYAGGNLLGYILAGALPKPTGKVLSMVIVTLIACFGMALGAFGWISSTWIDFAINLALGVGNGYIGLVLITWIQQSTPKDMLGRVMSMVLLASMGLVPFSQAIAGAVSKWNLTGMFALAGALMLLVALWLGLNPGLKELSRQMLDPTDPKK
jgi:MFS family permease